MKNVIFVLAVLFSVSVKSQSLKEALYGGKLKLDSNTVIRKGDDLSTKIDTTTKKQAPMAKPVVTAPPAGKTDAKTVVDAGADVQQSPPEAIKETVATPVKSNSKIWKAYNDSLVSVLKSEVLSSKKIKKETYYLTVDYEIGADGQVTINTVSCDPENEFLQNNIKERLMQSPPQLAPVLDSNNQPRKTKRKQTIIVTKD